MLSPVQRAAVDADTRFDSSGSMDLSNKRKEMQAPSYAPFGMQVTLVAVFDVVRRNWWP
jgi:hypothetical protein